MIITGGFYAQAANVSDQKLNVLGGVWDGYAVQAVGDDRLHSITAVVLIQIESGGHRQASVSAHMTDPDGRVIWSRTVPFSLNATAEQGFLIVPLAVSFARTGRHVLTIGAGSGVPVALPLQVRLTEQMS